jgi:hypothetical protein
MARRRLETRHPAPEAIAETVRQDKTSFGGAGAFLAGEGALAFAADREGLAEVYERVWLRPSAARRLAGFLDLRPPGVIGYRVAVNPNAPAQLGGREHPFETLDRTLKVMQGATIDSARQLCVTTVDGSDGTIEAMLTYHHHFKLSGGQWSIDQPCVTLKIERNGQDALLAAVVSRGDDIVQVRRVALELERRGDSLVLEEVALPQRAVDRHRSLRVVLDALGDPDRLRVGNYHTRERERGAADPPAGEWGAHNEAASYRMRPHSVGAMLQRIEEVDDASFASALAYLPKPSGLIVAVTLRQNPGRDDHLGMFFHGARRLEAPDEALSKQAWDDARPVDWDEREKTRRVLGLWVSAARALLAAPNVATSAGQISQASSDHAAA